MTEKPILFTGPMVRAILDGRKTVTRRIVKLNHAGRVQLAFRQWHLEDPDAIEACPYGQPGDVLWVRETWGPGPFYRADDPTIVPRDGWRPSIHMERRHARLFLRVKSVRIEQLQEISEDDAIAEGTYDGTYNPTEYWPIEEFKALWDRLNAKRGYGWDVNPWVWRIEFKPHARREVRARPTRTNRRLRLAE